MHHVTLLPPAADTVYSQRAERLKRGMKEKRGGLQYIKDDQRLSNKREAGAERCSFTKRYPVRRSPSPRLDDPSRRCPPQTPAVVWSPQRRKWWDVDRCILSCCHTDTQSTSLYLHGAPSRSLHSLAVGDRDRSQQKHEHEHEVYPESLLQKNHSWVCVYVCVCLQTLIRNLRDSSTRVTLLRPALWQMDTALVDQAVEKFNLRRKTATTTNKNTLKTWTCVGLCCLTGVELKNNLMKSSIIYEWYDYFLPDGIHK